MAFSLDRVRHLYDFDSHFLTLGGHRCHYLDEGRGAPLVMVHGNPSWSFMYRELVRDLRRDYRVIAPDHIGCGLSDKPAPASYPYTLARRIDDFEMLLERLGLDQRVTLMVHDWGGPIALGAALRRPRSIARLVLFNTAAFPAPRGKKIHWTLRFCRRSRLAAALILRLNLFAWAASHLGSRGMPALVRFGYTGPYDSPANRIATLRFVQDIPLEPEHVSYPELRRIGDGLQRLAGRPLLLCWGDRDFVFDADFRAEWERRFPDAEVHRFSQAGHYIVEDIPGLLIPLIRDFLKRHPG